MPWLSPINSFTSSAPFFKETEGGLFSFIHVAPVEQVELESPVFIDPRFLFRD